MGLKGHRTIIRHHGTPQKVPPQRQPRCFGNLQSPKLTYYQFTRMGVGVTGAPHQYPDQRYCLKDGRYFIPITLLSPQTTIIEQTIIVLGSHTIIRIKFLPCRGTTKQCRLVVQTCLFNNIQKEINHFLTLLILFHKLFYHYWSIYIISIPRYMSAVTQY